jgi:hypothetical protein
MKFVGRGAPRARRHRGSGGRSRRGHGIVARGRHGGHPNERELQFEAPPRGRLLPLRCRRGFPVATGCVGAGGGCDSDRSRRPRLRVSVESTAVHHTGSCRLLLPKEMARPRPESRRCGHVAAVAGGAGPSWMGPRLRCIDNVIRGIIRGRRYISLTHGTRHASSAPPRLRPSITRMGMSAQFLNSAHPRRRARRSGPANSERLPMNDL